VMDLFRSAVEKKRIM